MTLQYTYRTDLRQVLIIFTIICFFVTLIFVNYVFFSTRAYIYEQTIRNQPPPIPGKFLWELPVNNESYCNFNYGLPAKLNYTEKSIRYSPQEGVNSSYRVLYNAVEANYHDNVPNLTYVTHVTVDFVLFIPEIVKYWDGPISIAAFLPAQDAQVFFQKLFHVCVCYPQMSRVSIHLIFPVHYEPYFEETSNFSTNYQDCKIKNEFLHKMNRVENNLPYPINVGRNIARKAANTRFVMVSDIELMPSKHLARKFLNLVKLFRASDRAQVFVVPIFEIETGYKIPTQKKDLMEYVKLGVGVYFHRFVCPHCQKFPGIDNWLGINNRNGVRPFISVKREYPFHRWEPIFIGTRQEPLYDEALSWEGLQDKMTQMLKMCLLNYKFVILDGAFLTHWPGIKRKSQRSNEAWRTPYIKRNSEIYSQIIEHLSTSPEYTRNKRCKLQ